MKATEQYLHVVLFLKLYKVVLTFKSVDETLVCDHSNVKLSSITFMWYCIRPCSWYIPRLLLGKGILDQHLSYKVKRNKLKFKHLTSLSSARTFPSKMILQQGRYSISGNTQLLPNSKMALPSTFFQLMKMNYWLSIRHKWNGNSSKQKSHQGKQKQQTYLNLKTFFLLV